VKSLGCLENQSARLGASPHAGKVPVSELTQPRVGKTKSPIEAGKEMELVSSKLSIQG
jgi:hypothetical protein